MIKVGEQLPLNITLWKTSKPLDDGTCPIAQKVVSKDLFENKKVVLFAVPGAFTPTCSGKHLPGFLANYDQIKSKGIDNIICIATNDSFVMTYWGKDQKVGDKIQLVSDGNSEFTKKIGLDFDGSAHGMGVGRSLRYAMIVDNAVVKYLGVEKPGQLEVSTAEAILANL
ncbi:hypothetical protein SAMD00019534_113100 [Acytostelium subglobosum LB1]|uniref:hypothetical protein n=1 Tax=Acytostelium subglobosum LB1 TaxID=1410327 RepID=UPI000644FA50|nr:hypothetical protein SAMD00019534_113100 [Acytostelium subglobosum LB1]GAM28134.1 hypothetical protein SAMD00019534_113100 [Acytostelium subglobosum LB1]|eukprot:XP_012748768.1 hypothetical protein SAMD00019534_113100 [Acytostelium subglobosum LB1]